MSFDFDFLDRSSIDVLELNADGFPPSAHEAESDLFSRQDAMPYYNRSALEAAHVGIVGCGGLGSWIALALARMGARQLTLIDPDIYDRTNAPRQLMFASDTGEPKAHALARNLIPHFTNAAVVRSIATTFQASIEPLKPAATALVVGVDNNQTRLDGARYGLANRIPVVFCMLSRDGTRAQVFCQRFGGPCLRCVLPNFDVDVAAPCAAASIASCLLAGTHTVSMLIAALMSNESVPTWRETSLDGTTERSGWPSRRRGCCLCATESFSNV